MSNILLTGGSGLLGTELQQYIDCYSPDHSEFDILNPPKIDCNLIIHCAAYTDVAKAEKEPDKCYNLNFWGTSNLVDIYKEIPFVYISSEYVNNPCNVYSWSKLAGENVLRTPYLIIRTLFKPKPYPYKKAFIDQYTQGDYVDIISKLIYREIEEWDRKTNKIINVGTGRKTMYELAKQTRPDVIPNFVDDIKEVKLQKDYL